MTTIERIKVGADWNARHGAYNVAFATTVGARDKDVDFDTFYRILVWSGNTGYPKEVLKRAFERGRAA